MIKKFIYFITFCLIVLLGIMLWNMKSFSSKQISIPIANTSNINSKNAIDNLSKSITYKTISNYDYDNIDAITFL